MTPVTAATTTSPSLTNGNGAKPVTAPTELEATAALDAAIANGIAAAMPDIRAAAREEAVALLAEDHRAIVADVATRTAGDRDGEVTARHHDRRAELLAPTPRSTWFSGGKDVEPVVAPIAPVILEYSKCFGFPAAPNWVTFQSNLTSAIPPVAPSFEWLRAAIIADAVTAATSTAPISEVAKRRRIAASEAIAALPPVGSAGSIFYMTPKELCPPHATRSPGSVDAPWIRQLASDLKIVEPASRPAGSYASAPNPVGAAVAARDAEIAAVRGDGADWGAYDTAVAAIKTKHQPLIERARNGAVYAVDAASRPGSGVVEKIVELIDTTALELARTKPGSLSWWLVSTLRWAWDATAPKVEGVTAAECIALLRSLGARFGAGGAS